MRSPRKVVFERIRSLANEEGRFVDMAAQIRVYRRGPDGVSAVPAELLPRVYGGRYDRWLRAYSGEAPEKVSELSCHPGQLRLWTHEGPEMRTLLVGAPGGGKSFAIEGKAVLLSLDRPASTGGIVAPTNERRGILWKDALQLLEPLGWIEDVRQSKWELRLVNAVEWQFRTAKRQSARTGTPLQGYNWDWAVEDEAQNIEADAHREVNFRGRRAGKSYRIFSSATNQAIPEFQVWLDSLKELQERDPPSARVLFFSGYDNVFVDPAFYDEQRNYLSEEDFLRIVEGRDVPLEGLVYPKFSPKESLRELPIGGRITEELTAKAFDGRSRKYIIGHDPGSRTAVSIVLQAFRDPRTGDTLWWAVDEITTEDKTSAEHANEILKRYRAEDIVVMFDPHGNKVHNDRADLTQFRLKGIEVHPAAGTQIAVKHRFAMVNALLRDANTPPVRRLFIACDAQKQPRCKRLVESFKLYKYDEYGRPFQAGKKSGDLSHWTDAVGYGLFRWERIRGSDSTRQLPVESDRTLSRLTRSHE